MEKSCPYPELLYFSHQEYKSTIDMEQIRNYIDIHKDRFMDELFGLLKIPSISAISDYKEDMLLAAEYWKDSILAAGADKAEIYPTTRKSCGLW